MATTLPPFASTSRAAAQGERLRFPPPPPLDDDFEYDIELVTYAGEHHLPIIIALIEKELSEPYLIYTYRYFLNEWPHLSWLAYSIPRRRPPPLPPRTSEQPTTSAAAEDVPLGVQVDSLSISSTPSTPPHASPHDDLLTQHATDLRRAPVGVIVNKMDRHLKGDRLMRGYIAMLSIHPSWRKKGIARKLVQAAIDRMSQDGAQEIVLETEVDNSGALALYDSLGFIREKRLYRFYLNGKDSFRLVLPLVDESDNDSQEQLPVRPGTPVTTTALRHEAAPSTPDASRRGFPDWPDRPQHSPWRDQVYDFDGLIM